MTVIACHSEAEPGEDLNEDLSEHYDCQSCGACCVTAGEVIVTTYEDVPAAMTTALAAGPGATAAMSHAMRRMIRVGDGRCIALRQNGRSDYACGIYHRRPNVCREFAAGSEDCLIARDAAGIGRD